MVKLYESFIDEDVKIKVSEDVFTFKLMNEFKSVLNEESESEKETTESKSNVLFIAKMLKPIVSFITKHNPAKYIILFASKGIDGLASLLPEDSKLREMLIKVYNKLESTMKKLFELPHESGGKTIEIGGYRISRSKIIGFVIAAFSYSVILGAILRKIDEIKNKNSATTESTISIKDYMLSEADVGAPKNPLSLTVTMIKKYGETQSLVDKIVDESKKTFVKIIATIIAAAVSLIVFYLFNCVFFKLFIRLDSMIKRISFEEYSDIVKTFLSGGRSSRSSGMKGIGLFTNMYITLCNIFGETLKISMFRKDDLNSTLAKCLEK